jgi:hypothetical protein
LGRLSRAIETFNNINMTEFGKISGGKWVGIETRREAVGCRCPSGHRFSAELLTAISLLTDRLLVAELEDKGVQERKCPACQGVCRLAEPVGLHDPQSRRFALYVPESLSHRRIALLALTLEYIATLDPTATPEYFETPALLCGRAELRRWLGGPTAVLSNGAAFQADAVPRHPDEHGSGDAPSDLQSPTESSPGAPEIHAAFADLVNSGSVPGQHTSESAEFAGSSGHGKDEEQREDDDWLSGRLLTKDPAIHHQDEVGNPLTKKKHLVTIDVVGNEIALHSTEQDDQEENSPQRPGNPSGNLIQPPGPTGIEDSSIKFHQGSVYLSYRVKRAILEMFGTPRADLWFQLFEIEAFPLVTLTLVSDSRAAEPETLTWLLDLTRPEQWAIATTLQRRYRARVQLHVSSSHKPLILDLGGHRESNVSVVLDRATAMLAGHPPEDRPFDRAAEKFDRLKAPHGNVPVPLEFYEPRPTRTFEAAAQFIALVADWFGDEKYNYLIFVRSFPLDTFEELVRHSLEQAMAFGVCVPETLIARALTLGMAGSRKELTAKLVERFATLARDDGGISDDAAVDNWTYLLRRAYSDKISIQPELIQSIEQQVARAGRTNDPRLQEYLSKLKAVL